MRLMRLCAIAFVLGTGGAVAEPVDEKAARKMLFAPKGFSVEVLEDSGLSATQIGYFRALSKDSQFERTARYYGAIAVSPTFFDRVLAGKAGPNTLKLLQFTDSYHNPQAASAAAMNACQSARQSGDKPCVLAARIFPRKWKPQPVSLSVGATGAFKQYRRGDTPKAFAVSNSTKAYSVVIGENAGETALARCNAQAKAVGSSDCEIVILD